MLLGLGMVHALSCRRKVRPRSLRGTDVWRDGVMSAAKGPVLALLVCSTCQSTCTRAQEHMEASQESEAYTFWGAAVSAPPAPCSKTHSKASVGLGEQRKVRLLIA